MTFKVLDAESQHRFLDGVPSIVRMIIISRGGEWIERYCKIYDGAPKPTLD